ncbi:alpha/beta hydrolase [Halocalculus aciditolerans]|uniref:Acetylhydrolase n=1 Tax=Halocalculus aciditolerans TaxID=1383812 RepID=A0A830FBM7_9EURY|nr:alpha/beta hydrolase [Halocalculus aciditolerans]GGL58968.1 acetylhydrolase [Halocalculus aciditolerans]
MAELDSELAAVVADIEAAGVPEWHALSVECARRVEDDVFTPEETDPEVAFTRTLAFETEASRPDDAAALEDDVSVRLYRDTAETPVPVLVFYHGGGWTLGTLDSIDGVCRRLAARTGCLVASVDYRLAPEHPFPTPLDDAYAALEWVAENADAFGGDGSRLAVAGTSAGGNLAAAVARRSAREDGPTVDRQLLLYPMVSTDLDRASYVENADGPLLTRADVAWFWEQYLRSPVDAANPYADLLAAPDYAGLPPATVVTAGADPLRDEGIAYADALVDAGVDVTHRHYPEMAHGFLSLTDDVTIADDALDAVAVDVAATWE